MRRCYSLFFVSTIFFSTQSLDMFRGKGRKQKGYERVDDSGYCLSEEDWLRSEDLKKEYKIVRDTLRKPTGRIPESIPGWGNSFSWTMGEKGHYGHSGCSDEITGFSLIGKQNPESKKIILVKRNSVFSTNFVNDRERLILFSGSNETSINPDSHLPGYNWSNGNPKLWLQFAVPSDDGKILHILNADDKKTEFGLLAYAKGKKKSWNLQNKVTFKANEDGVMPLADIMGMYYCSDTNNLAFVCSNNSERTILYRSSNSSQGNGFPG